MRVVPVGHRICVRAVGVTVVPVVTVRGAQRWSPAKAALKTVLRLIP